MILTVVTTFVLTAAIIWMFQKLKASERELSTLKKLTQQHLSVEDVQSICSRKLKTFVITQEKINAASSSYTAPSIDKTAAIRENETTTVVPETDSIREKEKTEAAVADQE